MNAISLTAKLADPLTRQRQEEKARNKIVLYRQQEKVMLLKKPSGRIRDPHVVDFWRRKTMDSIFIWMLAGATISLLGVFLIASERELKSKRQELKELQDKLAEGPVRENSNNSTAAYPQEDGTSAELVARNEALLQQVSSLSKKLETSESKLEQLETLRAHLNGKESENAELLADRERLQAELSTLRNRTESKEPRLNETDWNSEGQAKITELKEQLDASQAKLHDLESAREQLVAVESHRKDFEELQRSHEASTLQLQNALAAEQENRKALETTQMQLSDMEQRYQELTDANVRLREENSQLQQQMGQNQRQAERLEILRQRLEELRLKQADMSEQDQVIQQEIIAVTQLLDAPQHTTQPESLKVIHHDRRNVLDLTANKPVNTENGDAIQQTPFGAPKL
jgi:DNA repair exonuclease SbcCD ATPase subunit